MASASRVVSRVSNKMMSSEERMSGEGGDRHDLTLSGGGGGDRMQAEEESIGGDSVFQDRRFLLSAEGYLLGQAPLFRTVHTAWLGVGMIFLSVGVFITSAVLPFECNVGPSNSTRETSLWLSKGRRGICFMNPVSFLLYLHCGMWAFFLLCDQFIRYQHSRIRRRGYLDFYHQSHLFSQLPFWIVSAWSTLLLAISTVLHDHCKSPKACAKSIHLTKSEYLTICIGLETLVLLVIISSYIYQVWRFNKRKDPPDVFREDMMGDALDFRTNTSGQVDEEVFQKQADLIRYYKERNVILQKTLYRLSNQVTSANNTHRVPDSRT